jgi:hypothetical protein
MVSTDPFAETVTRGSSMVQREESLVPLPQWSSNNASALSSAYVNPIPAFSSVHISELEDAPVYLEPRSHFVASSAPAPIWGRLLSFLGSQPTVDYEIFSPFKLQAIGQLDHQIVSFHISLFRPVSGDGTLVEVQRRRGCSIAFSSFYRACMSAALDQVSPFTFDSRGDSREVAASLSLSAQGETPLSPTPSTNVDLLLGMLQSSTLEAKAEAFCALSDLASHPSSGSFVVQRIFAQSAPLLPCIESALMGKDSQLATFAASLLLVAATSLESPSETSSSSIPVTSQLLVSSLTSAMLTVLAQDDSFNFRLAKRSILQTLIAIAEREDLHSQLLKKLGESKISAAAVVRSLQASKDQRLAHYASTLAAHLMF